jgi:hypothetical protein
MAFQKMLLKGEHMAPGEEKRLFPSLDVSKWDRLHFHISGGNMGVNGLSVRVLFGTPEPSTSCKALLADSTIWFEKTATEREFSHTVPSTYNGTGFVMSVPVIAPLLYDIILKNNGGDKPSVYVAVMTQEV